MNRQRVMLHATSVNTAFLNRRKKSRKAQTIKPQKLSPIKGEVLVTESEYREVIDEKGTLENLELASQSIKNVFRYIDQLEARVTFLEKENQALGEKLEKVKNYNKNPRVAQINKSKANENALRLLKHFREAIEEGYKSNKAIAERLTQKGVKTPRGNEKWQFTTVHNYRKRLRSLGHQI